MDEWAIEYLTLLLTTLHSIRSNTDLHEVNQNMVIIWTSTLHLSKVLVSIVSDINAAALISADMLEPVVISAGTT